MHEMLKPKRGEFILDLGCGTGRLTMQLASLVGDSGRVVGVDPDPCRIAIAKEQLTIDVPVAFELGSIHEALSFGPFDGIFSNYVFHWFRRTERPGILNDIYNSLKPGGRLAYLLIPTQNHPNFLERDIFSRAMPDRDLERAMGVTFDSIETWLDICTGVGFIVDSYKITEVREKRASMQAQLQFFEAVVKSFRADMLNEKDIEELKALYGTGNGDETIHEITVMECLATKT